MTPIPVPHRWLAALLGTAFLLDVLIMAEFSGLDRVRELVPLPGAAAMAVCAYLGVRRPALGATLGSAVLVGSSFLVWTADMYVYGLGLKTITLTELVSGVVLTVLVTWRATLAGAWGGTLALVTACWIAIITRSQNSCTLYRCITDEQFVTVDGRGIAATTLFGSLLLAGSVGAGAYLRRARQQRVESEMSALVRKQWPLGAALAVLGLLELSQTGVDGLVNLLSGAIAGACAFFAPKYPLRNPLIAAVAIAFLPSLGGIPEGGAWLVPFSAMAATMALIAYAVRYLPRRDAGLATAALVAANSFSIGVRSPDFIGDAETGLVLLFLLGVAVVTGWYFRARDRERHQTVRAAVNSAQQGERMALARELHDVVAHHVTGIVVQAQAALLVAEKNPDIAVTALEKIERSGTEALTAMRTLVGSLRDGTAGDAAAGQATTDLTADLHALVEHFVGPPVVLDLHLVDPLPHEVGRSVLRLVQESLTNVGKHAPDATDVRVRVAQLDDQLHIWIVDNGAARPANPVGGSGGYGLVGMRERVELLGGRFEAGPSGYAGWSVEAWLPLRKESS
jgi:signal transduction histidine kinase